jgi:hypothetical protein
LHFHRYGTPAHFSEVPSGGCFTFELDKITHVGMSISWTMPGKSIQVCAELWPGLADYKNAPGILEADVIGGAPVCLLTHAILEPAISPTKVHHGFSELINSPGALILNKDRVLLRVGDNQQKSLIDVEQGVNYPGGLDFSVVFYSQWRILCRGPDEHEESCVFEVAKQA